jgi:electron transport complex protein RnfD
MSSKPKDYSWMTKDKLMTYTFFALLAIAIVTIVMWWGVSSSNMMTGATVGMDFGLTVLINCLIAIGIAVGIDVLLNKVAVDSPLNIMSAAVFGLIVAMSYSVGEPVMRASEVLPLVGPQSFIYVALITVVGMVLFKKLQGLKRKFVNPAAAAKLLVLAFVGIFTVLIPADHLISGGLQVPSLAGPVGYDVIGGNGAAGFGFYVYSCFANPMLQLPSAVSQSDVFNLLFLQKFHGWPGGASSIAVIVVGIVLFALLRRYIKWRITAAYFASVAVTAVILNFVFPGGDLPLRLGFSLFVGSSIFLAFFMATDPASTPLTYLGQIIFGVGLGVLTVLLQTVGFFGGSILALVIMNLTSPVLDRVGKLKPSTEKKEPKLPKAKAFTAEKVKVYDCIRCGACMRVCCHSLSPILIKQAFDKQNFDALIKLNADYCDGCGHCSFVCPSRIDLKGSVLRAKAMLRQQ